MQAITSYLSSSYSQRCLDRTVSARVDIIQRFHNPSPNATPRAKYLFPVPARAAICGFEMHTADDRLLLGKVKQRQQARAEHEAALRQGKATALLDWATDDGTRLSSLGSRCL